MKMIAVVALALVAVVAAAPAAPGVVVQIVRSDFQQQPNGGYVSSFESEDGTKREETGELREVVDADNKPQQVIVVRGFYSYLGEDQKPVIVNYVADENGYQAEGDSIPKGPARR